MSPVMEGCEACKNTSSAMGCPKHSQETWGPVAAMTALWHVHRWVYDGANPDGWLIYHCDEHDPPEVRLASPQLSP